MSDTVIALIYVVSVLGIAWVCDDAMKGTDTFARCARIGCAIAAAIAALRGMLQMMTWVLRALTVALNIP